MTALDLFESASGRRQREYFEWLGIPNRKDPVEEILQKWLASMAIIIGAPIVALTIACCVGLASR